MKKISLLFLGLALSAGVMAQDSTKRSHGPCRKLYLDMSTGLNNNAGMLGLGLDAQVADKFTLNGGVGLLSTWGYKAYFGGKLFFNDCHKGWALGAGMTYSTGISEMTLNVETVSYGKQDVMFDLRPQPNVYASAFKYWSVGRKQNRFYLQLGLSLPTNHEKFRQLNGPEITTTSASAIKLLAPGGIIVGTGFSIGT